MSAYANIFLKKRGFQELIFAEEGPFEISENKNPLKITRYTVVNSSSTILHNIAIICDWI